MKKIQRSSLNLLSADKCLCEAVVDNGFVAVPCSSNDFWKTLYDNYCLLARYLCLKSGIKETIADYPKAHLGAISRSFFMSIFISNKMLWGYK